MSVLCICRKFLCVAASLAMAVSVNSCFDDSALKNSIDDLKDRVEALENFQKQVQGDIASLQEIIAKLQSSVTVNNVKSITELPLTGAAGTALFTVLGLLIAGAGALVYMKSRSVERMLRG